LVGSEPGPKLQAHPRGERALVEKAVMDRALVLEIAVRVPRERYPEALLLAAHIQERPRLLHPRRAARVLELARQLALQALVVEVRLDGGILLASVQERPGDVGAREGTRVDRKGGEQAAGDQSFQVLVQSVVGGQEFRGLCRRRARAEGQHPREQKRRKKDPARR